jgi:A/G-specific adenine glycosylase
LSDPQILSRLILDWYGQNARDLPWRVGGPGAYQVWVAEVMLQQTQVSRVRDHYYGRFLERFPNIFALAEADWEALLPYWRGLGFYSRGQNLLKTAKVIVAEHGGVFPREKDCLLQLPGIGPYTAAAIRSFAFGIADAAVDTNLERVLGRVLALPKKQVHSKALAIIHAAEERGFLINHALMDLGSGICTARKALCQSCPLSSACLFYQSGQADEWNAQSKRLSPKAPMSAAAIAPKPIIDVAVACIHRDGKYLIARRPPAKGGLWEFPGGKREPGEDWRHALKREIMEELKLEISARPHFFETLWDEGEVRYRLRFARCQILKGEPQLTEHTGLRWISAKELAGLPDFPEANRAVVAKLSRFKI